MDHGICHGIEFIYYDYNTYDNINMKLTLDEAIKLSEILDSIIAEKPDDFLEKEDTIIKSGDCFYKFPVHTKIWNPRLNDVVSDDSRDVEDSQAEDSQDGMESVDTIDSKP